MNPKINDLIKVFFRNGFQAEGFVEEWTDQKSSLRSLDGKSILIIQRTIDDIMFVKVLLDNKPNKINQKLLADEETDLEKKFDEVLKEPSDDNMRVKKLAELRILLADQDRKIVAQRLKDHHLPSPKGTNYGYLGFYKKPSTK